MKNLVLLMLLFSFLTMKTLCDQASKELSYTDFTKVSIGYNMKVQITQGHYRIRVKADEDVLERLIVRKEINELIFKLDNSYCGKKEVLIDIQMPDLTKLNLSGGAEAKINFDASGDVALVLRGGAELHGELFCQNLNIDLSGGSVVKIDGNCESLNSGLSGGSILSLKNFSVKDVDAELSGGSKLAVNMNGILDARLSGGSQLTHYGIVKMRNIFTSTGAEVVRGEKILF